MIEGNFYGFDDQAAKRDAARLNAQKDGHYYEVEPNMQSGGYQISKYRESDNEWIGYYDDGDQWNIPPESEWRNL
jgi:hypothetical protein